MVKTVWEYSLELEAKRVLQACRQTALGFYKVNGFYPVPYGTSPLRDINVVIPDLPYLSIPRFWEKAAKVWTLDIENIVEPELLPALEKMLGKVTAPDYQVVQKEWNKISEEFLGEIGKLLPRQKNKIKKIMIWPTNFGTSASFSIEKNGTAHVWIRSDQGVEAIGWCLITALTREDILDKYGGLWQESQMISDWLMGETPLSKYFPKTYNSMRSLRSKQNASMLEKSEAFLTKIGAPVISTEKIKNLDTTSFSDREKKLWSALSIKSPDILSMDEVGNILFANSEDDFSLYAISKAIQRLRD
ncbi:MAG: hypothetical protein Q8L51_01380, partial [Candidatus Amesbacteria bacterium]|nr:hypothetical protein [Candidatus Amesbacteria bacterium]